MSEDRHPTAADVGHGLGSFVAAVRAHYGVRLHAIVMFGSRARGEGRPDSDADVAVVLRDDNWSFWQEKLRLADMAYAPLIETGLSIQPWPVSLDEWQNPEKHANRRLLDAIGKDAQSLLEAA
mgnify:CR=1 FL=1